jgi:GMP synthase (glutamine-hydrolysing)
MSHGDKVTSLPAGFKLMASTDSCPISGMADGGGRHFYALQFHPEVTHTLQGTAILTRFVREICGCRGDWNMPDYVSKAVAKVRAQVGDVG